MTRDRENRGRGPVEIVPSGSALGDKVSRREGESPDAMFDSADRAIAAQAESYLNRIRDDLVDVRTAIDTALSSPDLRDTAVDRLFALLHNMKGQGATYGYQLVSQICALTCGVLQRKPRPDDAGLRVVKAHVDALSIVIEHDLAGDGGPLGIQLVERLQGLAAVASR